MRELHIKGYPNYTISDTGIVKNIKRNKEIKPIKYHKGYTKVYLYNNGESKQIDIHRLVAIHFIKNPHNKKQVNHKNGIKTDNRVENLEWVTAKENTLHSINEGLRLKRYPQKLNELQVRTIRKTYPYISQEKIAEIFNVNQTLISAIVRNKIWQIE